MTGVSFYRFATPAQQRACLITGLPETLLLDPAGGAGMAGLPGGAVRLVAVAPDGEPFAIDGEDRLCAGSARGPAVAAARRIVVGRRRIWVLAEDGLHQFDRFTLQRLLRLDAGETVDIAAAGDDGLWRLGDARVERWTASGRRAGEAHDARERARAIARIGGTLFLLSRDAGRLELIDERDGRPVGIDLSRLMASAGAGAGAGGAADLTGEAGLVHGADRLILWHERKGGGHEYMVLDEAGSVAARGRGPSGRPVALAGGDLIADFGGETGIRRFAGAAAGDGERWLTPAMETGSHEERWIRAEIAARLPEGATVSLRWAAIEDESLRETVEAVQADRSRSVGDRLAAATGLLAPYFVPEFIYAGQPGADGAAAQRLDFPLDAKAGAFLWLYVKLRRNDAARAPAIDGLIVHHGAERLIDHLPAIYRGPGDADGTLGRLVGIIEATTHGVDRTIAALAARLDPARADEQWLGPLAATLGLPFDEALTPAMRRRIVGAAGALIVGRGTRGGLAALFEALFPDRPVRILDRASQFIPVALGGGGFAGSRLPALLTGPSPRAARLNARLTLGGTALGAARGDGRIAPMPEVLVSIPATGGERRRFAAAVGRMAGEVVPAGVRLRLRWTPWRRRPAGPAAGWLAVADDPRPLLIGDGRLGHAAVGGRRGPRAEGTYLGPAGHRLL